MAKVSVSPYSDLPLNSFETYEKGSWVPRYGPEVKEWYTSNVTTQLPSGLRIGRVDHFRKHSVRKVVDACVKQIVQREGLKGRHMIEIELQDSIVGLPASNTQKMTIEVIAA